MAVNTKAGWIPAVFELENMIEEGGGGEFTPVANTPVPDEAETVEDLKNYLKDLVNAMIAAGVMMAEGGGE